MADEMLAAVLARDALPEFWQGGQSGPRHPGQSSSSLPAMTFVPESPNGDAWRLHEAAPSIPRTREREPQPKNGSTQASG